jgi:hypothetical protein
LIQINAGAGGTTGDAIGKACAIGEAWAIGA